MTEAGRETNGTDTTDQTAEQPVAAPDDSSNPLSSLTAALSGKAAAKAAAPAPAKAAGKTAAVPEEKPQPAPMPTGALVSVVTRNEFYRDGFRNLIKIVVLEAIIIVGLILALIVYINNSVSYDRYFATTADGRIMQLSPLDQPFMTESTLVSWVAQSATEVMTFGFHDYQRRLQQSSRHFTKSGWESFSSAMTAARIIESVVAQKQVVVAAPRSAPIVRQQGLYNGKYRWVVEMPLAVEYKGGGQGRTDNLTLRLTVERVSSLENPSGVGIEQWIAIQK